MTRKIGLPVLKMADHGRRSLPQIQKNLEVGNESSQCKGSFECQSQNCLFFKEYGRHDKANFDIISPDCSVCRICKSPAIVLACPAVKVWEFDDNYVVVKHTGKHTCPYVPLVANNEHTIAENVKMRPDLPPKKLQREAMLSQLYGGKTIGEVKVTAQAMIDTRKIASVRSKSIKSTHPLGHSIEALKN